MACATGFVAGRLQSVAFQLDNEPEVTGELPEVGWNPFAGGILTKNTVLILKTWVVTFQVM